MQSIFKLVVKLAALAVVLQLGACASIVSGTNQSVSVETQSAAGESLAGANCKLSNNKGTWFVTTPGSTVVNRSFEDLAVLCEKENHAPGLVSAKSSTKGMAFGNLLFGGVIGAGVDISTGAAYDYPPLIKVRMGRSEQQGRPTPTAQGGATGSPGNPTLPAATAAR